MLGKDLPPCFMAGRMAAPGLDIGASYSAWWALGFAVLFVYMDNGVARMALFEAVFLGPTVVLVLCLPRAGPS